VYISIFRELLASAKILYDFIVFWIYDPYCADLLPYIQFRFLHDRGAPRLGGKYLMTQSGGSGISVAFIPLILIVAETGGPLHRRSLFLFSSFTSVTSKGAMNKRHFFPLKPVVQG